MSLMCSSLCVAVVVLLSVASVEAQPPGGPMGRPEIKLVEEFDSNDDGWLNQHERQAV